MPYAQGIRDKVFTRQFLFGKHAERETVVALLQSRGDSDDQLAKQGASLGIVAENQRDRLKTSGLHRLG